MPDSGIKSHRTRALREAKKSDFKLMHYRILIETKREHCDA
jgi:hypothetical protein